MDLEKAVIDMQKAMAAADEQHKTLFRRMLKVEENQETMHSFAISLEKLTSALASTDKKVDGLCSDVEIIKQKPAKRWETLVMDAMKVIVGGLIGYLLVRLGIG